MGIDRARGLVAAVGTDAENVYAVLTARVLKSDLFVIARAESEDSAAKLKRAGADRVISPYRIGALQMAQTALRPAVVDFFEIATNSENLELSMEQVKIGKSSALEGHSLGDSSLRQRYGVVVVGIQRAGGRMEFNPSPETTMSAGDHLVVLGSPASLKELKAGRSAEHAGTNSRWRRHGAEIEASCPTMLSRASREGSQASASFWFERDDPSSREQQVEVCRRRGLHPALPFTRHRPLEQILALVGR